MRTLRHPVGFSGVGLHSGNPVRVLIRPTQGPGIFFNNIKADFRTVTGTPLCTKIGQVRTIEHLMCAFYILGITGADVILEAGDEIPILDGGAFSFVEMLRGNTENIEGSQDVEPFVLKTLNPEGIEVRDPEDPEKFIRMLPDFKLSVDLQVDFNGLKQQFFYSEGRTHGTPDFLKARTFCYLRDVEQMQKNGMALGGNLRNSIVLDNNNNPINQFLFDNELAKHKMIDFLGDLYGFGRPIKGRIICSKPGHYINNLFIKKLGLETGLENV